MKLDFTYENPTKIYFGRTAMEGLKTELAKYGIDGTVNAGAYFSTKS